MGHQNCEQNSVKNLAFPICNHFSKKLHAQNSVSSLLRLSKRILPVAYGLNHSGDAEGSRKP